MYFQTKTNLLIIFLKYFFKPAPLFPALNQQLDSPLMNIPE